MLFYMYGLRDYFSIQVRLRWEQPVCKPRYITTNDAQVVPHCFEVQHRRLCMSVTHGTVQIERRVLQSLVTPGIPVTLYECWISGLRTVPCVNAVG